MKPSQALLKAQADVSQLIIKWDANLANRIAADNLFLDIAPEGSLKPLEGVGGAAWHLPSGNFIET